MAADPTFLGTVQDVQGATISVSLDEKTASGLAFVQGHGYRIGQIGSFIRISIGFTDLYGIVSHVGAGAVPEAIVATTPFGNRWIRVQLVGEGQRSGEFQRGISQYPTIGDEAHLVTERDLAKIYGRPDSLSFVRLGSLAASESIPALLDINRLVSRHSAVLGTTGSGKSTTVASLLKSISDPARYPSTRVIILDLHGEYSTALKDRAVVFRVDGQDTATEKPLYVPYWALSFDELMRVTPFHTTGDADRTALAEKVRLLKESSLNAAPRAGVAADTLTVDTPIPFSIHRLWYDLHRKVCSTHTAQGVNQSEATEAIEKDAQQQPLLGDICKAIPPRYSPITASAQAGASRVYLSGSPLNITKPLAALGSLLRDTRFDFLFRPGPWFPQPTHTTLDAQPAQDLDALLESWLGGERPIKVFDLSGVPVSIQKNLIGVVLRLVFEALFWSRYSPEGGRQRPLLFVLEEAHAYLSAGNDNNAAEAVRRIVKEGRKYGVSAMIVSQRPAEIDATVLSQCGTMLAMRLANAQDRGQVISAASDHLEGLFSMLPALRTGEVIVVGEAVHLPLRALVDPLPKSQRPDSHDPQTFDPDAKSGWNRAKQAEQYARMLKAWRSEDARSGQQGGV
ncbi:MAG: ATPase [Planctomycetota bacterium]|nr:ATPase [Planctomycetota bacterium]GIK51428.1 MAG: ATPase [Planctomycetota bacterium]